MKNKQQKMLSERLILVLLALCAVVVNSEDYRHSVCPEVCYCDKSQCLVDCGYRSLDISPDYIPVTARHYSVAGNRIHFISAENLLGLDQLVSLDLSENFISELQGDLFDFTPELHTLRLNGNRLKSIPAASLSKLHSLKHLFLTRNGIISLSGESEFSSLSLLTLDLSGNEIVKVPDLFLDKFPQLHDLRLTDNKLTSLEMNKWTGHEHGIEMLDVSENDIHRIVWSDVVYYNVKVLNASNNSLRTINASWFSAMPNLDVLELCANPFHSVANNTFLSASCLRRLVLCKLPNLQYIDGGSFAGLTMLEELDLSSNYHLSSIHQDAFTSLYQLQHLNVRNNGLRTLQLSTTGSNLETVDAYFAGTRWLCDCHLGWIYDAHVTRGSKIGQDIACSAPPELRDIPLFEVKEYEFSCKVSEQHHVDQIVSTHISNNIMLHCLLDESPESEVIWTTSRGTVIHSVVFSHYSEKNTLQSLKHFGFSVFNRGANISRKFWGRHVENSHFQLLRNGSLIVKDITRADTGHYVCSVVNGHNNVTQITELRLDYSILSSVMIGSVVVGGACAFGFLLIALIVATVRHISHSCSARERTKRRSLRELLSQMRNNAQFNRLSTYRAAQMDRLSAFKSATMDHISSFTSNRIGRLRRYKQSTVSGVLHHLERMREHYSVQMDHVKESYRMNAARLRHSYMARFRDNKSMSVRKQYRASVARARDYSNEQIARLREQYKQQQQYLLKLLELIDVGSCVSSSVEAECIRAESAIFDASVEFDDEARPSYVSRPDDADLFSSTSSLPEDCGHRPLPPVLPPSVDFSDVVDCCAPALRAAVSAPSIHICETICDDPVLVHAHSTTVYCEKAPSSPAVINTITDTTYV